MEYPERFTIREGPEKNVVRFELLDDDDGCFIAMPFATSAYFSVDSMRDLHGWLSAYLDDVIDEQEPRP